jgi:uncharacterized protein (TIGR03437 family)
MKCTCVLLALAGLSAGLYAQTVQPNFTTGQAARMVIGQTTFTSQDPNSSDVTLGAVSGIAYANDTLFITDSNRVGALPSNHRVLVYKGVTSMFPNPSAELDDNRKCPVCLGQATLVMGQPDFTTTAEVIVPTTSGLRLPTAVASDGVHVVVADTNHNRLLIWNRIPSINNQPADVVVGQPNFSTATVPPSVPNAKSLRGPQGVWIANGKLYVADTQNNRVLIYNRIPTSNGVAADVVLGAPDFTTFVEPDLTHQTTSASATNMLNPVSVTTDGVRLFVTDLGYNRVLVWNSIPSTNAAPADLALGQPDLSSSIPNFGFKVDPADTTVPQIETPVLCTTSNGTDVNGHPTYPVSCNSTLNFPRFALSTGDRLFIADGGNDRVLVFNTIPTASGTAADYVIGQIGGSVNQASDAADSLRTPLGLAWDGTNLYVSDAFNRRVTLYSIGSPTVPYQGVVNAASFKIVATANVVFDPLSTIKAADTVTITIGGTDYKYTVQAEDTLDSIIQSFVDLINGSNSGAGDPNVLANADPARLRLLLTSKLVGAEGNATTLAVTLSSGAVIIATPSGANLSGGGDAARVAPGTIVAITGTGLSANTANADLSQPQLPTTLGETQVYFNGIRAPLYMVSPNQVNAQVPWEVQDTTSINAYVRSVLTDGSIMTTTPVAVSIVPANPGLYTVPNSGNPPVGMVFHGSSSATGIISVDGTATAGDVATVTVQNRSYSYTVVDGDTLDSIRDNLVVLINQDPIVTASAAGAFDRIIITARVQGPVGNDIEIGASANAAATVIMTAFNPTLCCANVEGAQVTPENPAVPGEIIVVYATGLGLPVLTDQNKNLISTGQQYPADGPITMPTPDQFVSAIAGQKTADVLTATVSPGQVGVFKVTLHLNTDLPTDPATALTIAQDVFVSNVITFPIVNQVQ